MKAQKLEAVGIKLKQLRVKKGFSQFQLEIDCSMSYGAISRIENGNINPTLVTLLKLIRRLELDKEELEFLFTQDA